MLSKKKPVRYYNIRIDAPTYKQLQKVKGKDKTIVAFMREVFALNKHGDTKSV